MLHKILGRKECCLFSWHIIFQLLYILPAHHSEKIESVCYVTVFPFPSFHWGHFWESEVKGGGHWRKIEKQKEAVSACRFAGFTLTISKAFRPVHLSRAKALQPYVSNHSKDILLVCFHSRATETAEVNVNTLWAWKSSWACLISN